jgi:peptidoglycan/xylan/chitin deacetylase (PgdA/CDA1 family)
VRALSLEYHDVVPGADYDASGFAGAGPASYKMTLARFAEHLSAIAASGCQPVRATDWLAAASSQRPLFITFDDGGVGAHGCIADALEHHGWRGHFFVTAGQVGTPTFLSGAQMRELRDRGHVIGAHSYSHPKRMGALPPDVILDEWRRSTAILSDALGEAITTASVPGGFYTPPVGVAAAESGLTLLFTSAPTTRVHEVDGCRVLGRYTLRQWSPATQAAALAAGRARPRVQQWALYSALNLARTVAGEHYTRLRQWFWSTRTPAPRS